MQTQNTLLIAASTEESRRQLREIFQDNFQIMESQSADQIQLILSDNPGLVSAVILDAGKESLFSGDGMAFTLHA
ncbi:MAG: hypothetical protein IKV72_05910, partial [Firmicutes bacterium]|nr:hypothetical protein [Bacillota bacterium]